MHTQRAAEQLEFSSVGRREVVAAFDGSTVSSDAGVLLLGKLTAGRKQCAPLAGKSTLNRLELFTDQSQDRYHNFTPDPEAMDRLWVDLFLEAHRPRFAPTSGGYGWPRPPTC